MGTAQSFHIEQVVSTDYDLIALRQTIRQAARTIGLPAPQQARITAAISEVARVMLSYRDDSVFTIRVTEQPGQRPALEIDCSTRSGAGGLDHVYASPSFGEARALVDDSALANNAEGPHLVLRMWIGK